ncbi:efflux RND transporter periplasmic adaptor subunit [Oecophyllibacter saccharovorans]|uniref:Efflux RND transporter periplasmic adaptor subunit n=1 Tax=Oecophyllibacter saccharovorans TaxID=2558360 RepID=A0A506UL99_9PROT|nr:efflux RND transporter periplasmic adaptor subunit [Oecophyllibacter saccharovorans]QDH15263.1 efflux RND transporter periplasmic adaptor subunit [Oecophyllibacter saccharovorans]TPW34098.1 efflux RND transporter periplasmic adaptor subunit [Oecophyllibacter saccharovorans]TPW36280.1 efflux RND transporter periplasmic adaptor subunit [Oecophyllibacter saccharovorans]
MVTKPGPSRLPHSRKALLAAGLGLVGLYVAYLVVGKLVTAHHLRQVASESAIPDVAVIEPHKASPRVSLTLPGTINAWYQAPIYPQVSGYVKMWYKDFGAHVKQGEVLAEINTPVLDAQYAQAKADLAAETARYNLAVVTAARWRGMQRSQAVSGQSVSVANADEQAALAKMQAAQRNVDHYAALEKFKQIVAPFDGVVISRSTSVGDYVNSAGQKGANGDASELFAVADTHRMRLFVAMPEVFSYILQPGLQASVQVPQFPGKSFPAHFLTSSEGYDPNTRTAVTEFTMDNPHQELWPGTFASVALKANNDNARLLKIPTGCLVFQEHGMQVALVGPDNRVHFHDIQVGRMADSSTEVESGIRPTDRVINNPPADLLENDRVNIVKPAKGYDQTGWNEGEDDE